jgi:hypothetical protein
MKNKEKNMGSRILFSSRQHQLQAPVVSTSKSFKPQLKDLACDWSLKLELAAYGWSLRRSGILFNDTNDQ